jgi:hypothetical protein
MPRRPATETARAAGEGGIAMTVLAPGAIDLYFRAISDDDADALVACFTDDAEVSD